MTVSAASGSGDCGRGPTDTLAPAVPTLSPSRPSSPVMCARIQASSSGAYAAAMRRAASVMSVDAREVDVRGAPARLAQLRGVREQQARLAVPARGDEPHADAIAGTSPERGKLRLAVDQQLGRDRALEAEWGSLGCHSLVSISLTGQSGKSVPAGTAIPRHVGGLPYGS